MVDEHLFEDRFIISSITLSELEEIKTSSRKDEDIKAAARTLLRELREHADKFDVVIYDNSMLKPVVKKNLEINNDTKILACAIHYDRTVAPDDVVFYSNDLSLLTIANLFFGNDSLRTVREEPDDYTGYREIKFHEDALAQLYENLDKNLYNLNINEYLIVKDMHNNVIDKLCWTGEIMRSIKYYTFFSRIFGEVKPKTQDVY